MKLVLAEKPSVAQRIAKVLGVNKREDGYLEGNGYVVSWYYYISRSKKVGFFNFTNFNRQEVILR